MSIAPITFEWDGDAMIPLNPRLADRQYVVHEKYRLIPYEERSGRSHRHFFACLNEAFNNLPERLADEFPSADHLRRFALIKAGYCDEQTIVCTSNRDAERFAAFVRPIDEYAIVDVRDSTVYRWTAHSQSLSAMGKEKFQKSKDAVLDIISEMIGTDAAALQENVRKRAA